MKNFLLAMLMIVVNSEVHAFKKTLRAKDYYLNYSKTKMIEEKSDRWHEVKKVEGGGLPVKLIPSYRGKDVFWFDSIANGAAKERSEVRIRGVDIDFEKTHYLKFNFFISNNSDVNKTKDWNIISQCAQVYKVDAAHPVKSPPLSFQIKDEVLYIKTLHNYSDKWYPEVKLGKVTKGQWNSVWVRFKLGEKGAIVARLNKSKQTSSYRPIGYDKFYSPFRKDPKTEMCSLRFGIYRKGVSKSSEINRITRILFQEFSISDQYIRP